MKNKFLLAGILVVTLLGCHLKQNETPQSDASEFRIENENFENFYRKFNEDSVFQNSRFIIEDGVKRHINTLQLDTSVYKIWRKDLGEMVVERISLQADDNQFMEYVFQRQSGEWQVIKYYSNLNQ